MVALIFSAVLASFVVCESLPVVLLVVSFSAVVTSFFALAVASLALSGVLSIKKGK